MIKLIDAYKARTNFGDLINQVNYSKQIFIIQRARKKMAAVVPLEILGLLFNVQEQDIETYTPARIKEFEKADKIESGLKSAIKNLASK